MFSTQAKDSLARSITVRLVGLVEQILASHPQIHGAGELNDLEIAAHSVLKAADQRVPFPECIAAADQHDQRRDRSGERREPETPFQPRRRWGLHGLRRLDLVCPIAVACGAIASGGRRAATAT